MKKWKHFETEDTLDHSDGNKAEDNQGHSDGNKEEDNQGHSDGNKAEDNQGHSDENEANVLQKDIDEGWKRTRREHVPAEGNFVPRDFAGRVKKAVSQRYDKFQIRMIRFRKRRKMVRKNQLSQEEFHAWVIHEFRTEGWKDLVISLVLVVLVVLALLLCTTIMRGISSLIDGALEMAQGETTSETETDTIYQIKDITLGSTGSMLLHSPFIDSYPDEDGNYDFSSIFQYITPYYSAPDFMTCEFEGALGGEEMGYSGYPMFISPDVIIENIKDSGVDLQMLATNHIYDGWSSGFHRTMEVYEEKGIAYTGIRSSEQEKPYYIADIDGIQVGFIDYVYETTGTGTDLNGMTLEEEDQDLVNSFDYDDLDTFYQEMEENIRRMKQDGAQFLIAQMHWGTEYQLEESDYQDQIAQRLCDLGINAIIGGHPHCEQPIDVLTSSDGTASMFCIYSEGNALSNQRTYLMDEMPTGHTEDGVMITLTLHQASDGAVTLTDVDLLPTWVYRYQDDDGSKYFILPLDDVENIETTTGISGIQEDAQASYERTMEELGPGLEKAQQVFQLH